MAGSDSLPRIGIRAARKELIGAGLITAGILLLLVTVGQIYEPASPLEIFAVATGAACVWLLANNRPLGWWVGIASVCAFGVVFFQARLFAEVGIQAIYLVTSVQAILLWLRGGPDGTERPVSRVPRRVVMLTIPVALSSVAILYWLLITIHGAAPFWDALTTVLSLCAHIWLMGRYAESWWLWVSVDLIYIPLYASRGLHLTAGLYGAFLVIAVFGLLNFRRELHAGDSPLRGLPGFGGDAEPVRS
jgi:nicotinamide mononucleotide transporter